MWRSGLVSLKPKQPPEAKSCECRNENVYFYTRRDIYRRAQ
jgi:hypothetical protein